MFQEESVFIAHREFQDRVESSPVEVQNIASKEDRLNDLLKNEMSKYSREIMNEDGIVSPEGGEEEGDEPSD